MCVCVCVCGCVWMCVWQHSQPILICQAHCAASSVKKVHKVRVCGVLSWTRHLHNTHTHTHTQHIRPQSCCTSMVCRHCGIPCCSVVYVRSAGCVTSCLQYCPPCIYLCLPWYVLCADRAVLAADMPLMCTIVLLALSFAARGTCCARR